MKASKTTTIRLNQLKGDMTIRKFGDLIGIGDSTLFNYLKSRDMPLSVARKVAEATGCDLGWLAGIKDINGVDLNVVLKKNLEELTGISERLIRLCFE